MIRSVTTSRGVFFTVDLRGLRELGILGSRDVGDGWSIRIVVSLGYYHKSGLDTLFWFFGS